MKSVRLDPDRAARLKSAATRAGVTESEFIRRAIDRACSAATSDSLYDRVQDVIGIADVGDGVAERRRQAFLDILEEKRARLERAASAAKLSESGFVRRALDRALDETVPESLYDQIDDLIGIGHGGGCSDDARHTGDVFRGIVEGKRARGHL